MKKTYLRIIYRKERHSIRQTIEFFEGDIKEDKKYHQRMKEKARYFELKEKT